MNRTHAAEVLALHVLTEARERGVAQVDDQFARDVIAEAASLHGTRWDHVATAADARPAFSRVKAQARQLILAAQTRKDAHG